VPVIRGKIAYICFVKSIAMIKTKEKENAILKGMPRYINDMEILHLLNTTDINWKYVNAIKTLTDFKDEILSGWLNISVKTFREYKKPKSTFKENVKEQVLLLLSLIKHGSEVFGSVKEFDNWLNRENFYFDNKSPVSYLNTITGIKFIYDRLTAMEYGDNV
jgi:uncharacterized protein (DUF2384 family)